MTEVTFEKSIAIKKIGNDIFQSLHTPLWTWPGSKVVPGGTLMSLAAAAAYETVVPDFCIDTLHTYFLAGPKQDMPLQLEVQRLNDGGRFLTRMVLVKQDGRSVVHITCSFVRMSAMAGPSMTHSIGRETSATVDSITLDDLEPGKDSRGPIMKFQRLSVTPHINLSSSKKSSPDALTYTSVATLSTPISSEERKLQALGIIALSDYHILDAPPTLHDIPFGQPAINDHSRTPRESHFTMLTSLNHTIRFRQHEGFRADGLCYIEVTSPWTARRRAEVQSKIFSSSGDLIASCVQGPYYVMKDAKQGSKL